MRLKALSAALCSTATVLTGMTITAATPPAEARAPHPTIRVASFNISSVAFDKSAKGEHKRWRTRRPVVVSQILRQKPDVVGLQEANQSNIYRRSLTYGDTQFMDLKGALNAKGAHYAVTNRYSYNCVRSTAQGHCRHRYRGASQDNRILYNTRTLKLRHAGSVRFHAQSRGKNPRYLAWAVFQKKDSGKRFFFADTHLDPYSGGVRKAEWRELIHNVNRLRGSNPVVVVGDFNTSKFDVNAAAMLPAMKRAGYGDVLNQSYRRPVVKSRRAQSIRNGWLNSYNGFKRDVRSYAYEDAKYKTGNSIDWIFAGNRLRVRHYQVVANLARGGKRLSGVIPSDHNMVAATITLR
jgi:endonuclease/exonuclease/phosphatase family metal-dependent hydrolase